MIEPRCCICDKPLDGTDWVCHECAEGYELVGVNQSNVSRGLKQAFGELRQELQGLWPAVSTMEMPPELVDVVLEATAENGDD